ncbi:MAG: hypothetical protein ACI9WU_003877 [Myxococcota bacterium]|jgi:hypothetical protein
MSRPIVAALALCLVSGVAACSADDSSGSSTSTDSTSADTTTVGGDTDTTGGDTDATSADTTGADTDATSADTTGGDTDTTGGDTDTTGGDTDTTGGDTDTTGGDTSGGDGIDFELTDPQLDPGDDGIWTPGETITITATLKNVDTEAHSAYPGAALTTTTPGIEIDEFENWYFAMFAGDANPVDFTVTAGENVPPGTEVQFSAVADALNCADSGQNCPDSQPLLFSATVSAALVEDGQFVLSDPLVEDDGEDGGWSAGEMLFVTVTMKNVGDDHFNYPGAYLVSDNPDVTIAEFNGWLFGMFADDSAEFSFTATAGPNMQAGDSVTFTAGAATINCTGPDIVDESCPTYTSVSWDVSIAP